jgi:hypothetical protein
MRQLTVNLSGKTRRAQLNGREYIVAPMTMLVPGVLAGSKGPLRYTPEDVANDHQQWSDMPLVVYHPTRLGMNVSAQDPKWKNDILEKSGVGVVRKPVIRNGGKLGAEAWFDVEKTRKVDPRIIDSLNRGKPIELSTGLFTENEEAPIGSQHNGKSYTHTARNLVADHLAILPDQQGACSIKDGCGVLVNTQLLANTWSDAAREASAAARKKGTRAALMGETAPRVRSLAAAAKAATIKADNATQSGNADAKSLHAEAAKSHMDLANRFLRNKTPATVAAQRHIEAAESHQSAVNAHNNSTNNSSSGWQVLNGGPGSGPHKGSGGATGHELKSQIIDYLKQHGSVQLGTVGMGSGKYMGDMRSDLGHKKFDSSNPLKNPVHAALKELVGSGHVTHTASSGFGQGSISHSGKELTQNLSNQSSTIKSTGWTAMSLATNCNCQNRVENEGWQRLNTNELTVNSVPQLTNNVTCHHCGKKTHISKLLGDHGGVCPRCQGTIMTPSGSDPDGDGDDDVGEAVTDNGWQPIENRDWPQFKRDKTSAADFAGPDESFPIVDQADVDAAAHLVGRAANPEAVKSRIKAIAKKKGLSVPTAWQGESVSNGWADQVGDAVARATGASAKAANKTEMATTPETHQIAADAHNDAAVAHQAAAGALSKADDPNSAEAHDNVADEHIEQGKFHALEATKTDVPDAYGDSSPMTNHGWIPITNGGPGSGPHPGGGRTSKDGKYHNLRIVPTGFGAHAIIGEHHKSGETRILSWHSDKEKAQKMIDKGMIDHL